MVLQEREGCGEEGVLQGRVEVVLLDQLDQELEGLVLELEVVERGRLSGLLADGEVVLDDGDDELVYFVIPLDAFSHSQNLGQVLGPPELEDVIDFRNRVHD